DLSEGVILDPKAVIIQGLFLVQHLLAPQQATSSSSRHRGGTGRRQSAMNRSGSVISLGGSSPSSMAEATAEVLVHRQRSAIFGGREFSRHEQGTLSRLLEQSSEENFQVAAGTSSGASDARGTSSTDNGQRAGVREEETTRNAASFTAATTGERHQLSSSSPKRELHPRRHLLRCMLADAARRVVLSVREREAVYREIFLTYVQPHAATSTEISGGHLQHLVGLEQHQLQVPNAVTNNVNQHLGGNVDQPSLGVPNRPKELPLALPDADRMHIEKILGVSGSTFSQRVRRGEMDGYFESALAVSLRSLSATPHG
ncbi:unnamed protein product, partial [Amoebophrya sp. A25]